MMKINQAIIVEGKYDKIKLSSIIDATIIVTNGFSIFRDKKKQDLIKMLAKKTGIVVITDSDVAGFKIRNFIKSITKNENVTHIYIPQVKGKEKRKETASKEGILGVEGIDKQVLQELFDLTESSFDTTKCDENSRLITKSDLYEDGFIGKPDSKEKRLALLKHLDLPNYLTTNGLLDIINTVCSFDDYLKWVEDFE